MVEKRAIEYFQSKADKSFGNVRDSCKVAILALQKQVPMKIMHPIDSCGNMNTRVSYCFSCGKNVKDQLYCHGCGQRLDWGYIKF